MANTSDSGGSEGEIIRLKRAGRRGKIEVYLDVLKAVESEGYVGPTRLMYLSNLPLASLKQILKSLIGKGLVDELKISDRRRTYRLTEKGRKAVEALEEVNSIVGRRRISGNAGCELHQPSK